MEEGRVVRVAFQQADGQVKLRPAVVLKRLATNPDLLVCAISSKLHREMPGVDIVVDARHHFNRTSSIPPRRIQSGMRVRRSARDSILLGPGARPRPGGRAAPQRDTPSPAHGRGGRG